MSASLCEELAVLKRETKTLGRAVKGVGVLSRWSSHVSTRVPQVSAVALELVSGWPPVE